MPGTNFKTALAAVAVASLVGLTPAPAAQAGTPDGAGGGEATAVPATAAARGKQTVVSGPHLIHHAYKEALHAHEAVALDFLAMARNHAENVDITLDALDPVRDLPNEVLRNQVRQIRAHARNVAASPTATGSETLVGQFVALFAGMPDLKVGGGGGAGQHARAAMMAAPVDHLLLASGSFADAQVDAAALDFAAARIHAQHGVASLDTALRAARAARLDAKLVNEIQAVRSRANQLTRALQGKSKAAVQESGALVAMLGAALPRIAAVGGGGGPVRLRQQEHKPDRLKR